MPDGGEISAVFRGLADDAAQAGEDIGRSIARFVEKTADIEDGNVARTLAADSENARAINAIRPEPGDPFRSGAAGGQPNRIAQLLNGDSGIREMSAQEPSMGWRAYKPLSPKAKSLARALDRGTVDIRPGEVGTNHLAELTRGYEGEVGIVQGPEGDLKLIRGRERSVSIPRDLAQQGYKFVVHTHPEDRIPGQLTDLDKALGIPNSMTKDLLYRADGSDTHIEAVVNQRGDVTYFDHTGILPTSGGSFPGGPINSHGFVVPVKGK